MSSLEKRIEIIGRMDNSDGTLESANRVYGDCGIAPAISTFCGGGQEHKIIVIERIDGDG